MSATPTRREIGEQITEQVDSLRRELAEIDRRERTQALKEAFKELMQEQLARLGGWTLGAIGALVVSALLYVVFYIIAVKTGWTPPHQ